MVIWIIGLSGSGKTTMGRLFVSWALEAGRNLVILDGDEVRELFNDSLGHTTVDRRTNAVRVIRLCQFLDRQGLDLVVPILSISQEDRDFCRQTMSRYYEVFIDSTVATVEARDPKGLYAKFGSGEVSNVVGKDITMEPALRSDFIVNNNGSNDSFIRQAKRIFRNIFGE